MRLFAGGATTPLVVKIWIKQPWVKIEKLHDFDRDFTLSRGKIWLCLFYDFFGYGYGSTILHNKFQVISSKIEDVTAIFAIFDFFIFLSRFGHCNPQ